MAFWKMECPENYVALSGIATRDLPNAPNQITDPDLYRCIHKNFVEEVSLHFYF